MTIRTRLAATLLALALPAGAQAQSVQFVPSVSTVLVGDVFNVLIQGSGFAGNVDGGGFNLAFDGSVVRVEGLAWTPQWEFVPAYGTLDNTAGTLVNTSFNTFVNQISGTFTIGTLSLRALAPGTSPLDLGPSGFFPFASNGAAVEVRFADGAVNVVPEPGTYLSLLAGLGMLGAIMMRRRSAAVRV